MRQTLSIVGCTLLILLVLVFLSPAWADTAPAPSGLWPTPTAAPLPPGIPPSPSSGKDDPAALPNLIVESITTIPINPLVNVTCTIQVTIKNESETPLAFTNNFYTDLYVNPQSTNLEGKRGDVYWGVQGFYMGARQSYVMTTTWIFTDVVAQNLWVQVDTPTPPEYPRGDVIEHNEDDNILGPTYVRVMTNNRFIQQNHVDFMRGMCNTLDVVPVSGTLGIVTNVPGITITGDSAIILGVFEEPPYQWGVSANTNDYNARWPDRLLNADAITNNQDSPVVAASGDYLVAVWQDGRHAPIYGTQIYMTWSADRGTTWYTPTIRVNDDAITGILHEHPSVAVADNGDVVVAWQDRRSGKSFDIYVQQYQIIGTPPALTAIGGNERVDTDAGDHDQIYPDVAVDKEGHFYIAWQDQRNNNDDIFAVRSVGSGAAMQWDDDTLISDEPTLSKQSNPSIDVIMAVVVTDIDYEVITPPGEPPYAVITAVYTREKPIIVVAWEDWRNDNSDIYVVRSVDYGETYSEDTRVNQDPLNSAAGHFGPAIAVTMGMKDITIKIVDPTYGELVVDLVAPIAFVHIVWQDYRNSQTFYPSGKGDDPDIYYARFSYEPSYEDVSVYIFQYEFEEKINFNDQYSWQGEPAWQGYPEIEGQSSYNPAKEEWEYDIYIVWADGRNYGGEENNYDIYLQIKTNAAIGVCDYLKNNIAINDGVKLHNFRPEQDPSYTIDSPPPARQIRPSVTSMLKSPVFLTCTYIYSDYIFVVWDDDRGYNPPNNELKFGPFENRDIYFARTDVTCLNPFLNHVSAGPFAPPAGAPGGGYHYGSGTYVSEILDTGTYSATWYIVDWHAWTEDGTYVTVQTRLGNTITEVLNSNWYPNRDMPTPNNWPYPDGPGAPPISIGAPLEGYSAPGQHIIDAAGDKLPEARYIQYKINMWSKGGGTAQYPCYDIIKTPQVFDVILHYNAPVYIYLPLAFKNWW